MQGTLQFPIGGVYVTVLTPVSVCGGQWNQNQGLPQNADSWALTRPPALELWGVLVSLGHGFLVSCEDAMDRL